MSKCPARTWFNSAAWKKTSPPCSCSFPAFTAKHISWETPPTAGPVLLLQRTQPVQEPEKADLPSKSILCRLVLQNPQDGPDPLISPQGICNCANVNDAKFTFISKKTPKHSTNLNVGKSSEYLCFVCCGSLQGDVCPQKSLGQTCHRAFAVTQHT